MIRRVSQVKPHLFRALDGGWWCVQKGRHIGWGYTWRQAFGDFLRGNAA